MNLFESWLSLWVALAMVAGVVFGLYLPGPVHWLADFSLAQINLPIALLIWVMIFPMMLQINFAAIKNAGKQPKGLFLTLVVNWFIKPFTMAALGWLFFKVFFAGIVDPQTANQYIAGMILLGVAPCTAMVFVWSSLVKGNANYTLLQVSVNDLIMIFAFAPIAGLLLGISDIFVPWDTLLLSVLLYVVIPLSAAVLLRRWLLSRQQQNGEQRLQRLIVTLKPWSALGLIATVSILFALQAENLIANPLHIGLIAIPLLIQAYGIFALTYGAARWMKLPHDIAAPASFIGTSNFFELAVAVAITLYGLHSAAALATVVGVLVEVPVMLSLVALANRTRHWFPKSNTP